MQKTVCSRESKASSNKVLSKVIVKSIFFDNNTEENRTLYGKQRIVFYS